MIVYGRDKQCQKHSNQMYQDRVLSPWRQTKAVIQPAEDKNDKGFDCIRHNDTNTTSLADTTSDRAKNTRTAIFLNFIFAVIE